MTDTEQDLTDANETIKILEKTIEDLKKKATDSGSTLEELKAEKVVAEEEKAKCDASLKGKEEALNKCKAAKEDCLGKKENCESDALSYKKGLD